MGISNFTGQGANFTPAYQASGTPFVTSSNGTTVTTTPSHLRFPHVTRFIQVTNTSEYPLRIGFSENGVNGLGGSVSGSSYETSSPARCKNYLLLSGSTSGGGNQTVRLEVRCKELFIRSESGTTGFTLIAGLTGISAMQFPTLTGSAGFRGVG
tara:strand:+ start:5700 stop:6161 length:462 start_codon:yes stop_codon:yes gene_type:complete